MAVGSAHDHTLRLRGGDIDRGVTHAAGNQQTQAQELGQQPGGDRRALTHITTGLQTKRKPRCVSSGVFG